MVAPEPPHHIRQNGSAHFLSVLVHPPGVIQVVAFSRERLHHPRVLIKPVASLVVRLIGALSAVVVPPVAEKNANRLFLTFADDIRISIPSAQIHKTAHITQDFAKFVWTFPCDGESNNGAGARPADT